LTWHEVSRDKEGQTRVYKVPDTRHFRENPLANAVAVTPDYFRTMGIRVLQGRGFTDQDDMDSPRVVAVSETFARRIWPGQSAIGKRILGPAFGYKWDENLKPVFPTVVGVVEEARYRELTIPHLDIYQPYRQSTMMAAHHFVVRTVSDPLADSPAIRAAVREIDPELFLSEVTTIDEVVHSELAPWRFTTFLLSIFGFCAVLLASLGIFGVLAYSVVRRKHEIGIRMALGAQAFQVLKLVIGRGMRLTLAGLAVGIGLALGLTRFLSNLLYGVRPTDPVTFLGMSVLFVVVAALACYFPARRAARTDPAVALRYE
jgi:putative ABC transport system permease protein